VVDNIEDCWQPAAWKDERFAEARRLLADPLRAPEVLDGWAHHGWPGLSPDEIALMGAAEGAQLWRIYGDLPARSRRAVQRWVEVMVDGMRELESPARAPRFVDRDGIRVLAGEDDYNAYCFIVAGTVGHLSTELVIQQHGLDAEVAAALLERCEACGRALQKTNIVKDFAEDLSRGVSYLPDSWLREADDQPLRLEGAPRWWTARVVGDVLDELKSATEYVLALPYAVTGFRQASLMSLLPAYQTLLAAAERQAALFTPEHQVKMTRDAMAACLRDAAAMVADNAAVLAFSRHLDGLVRAALAPA
jgi:farnesyl-diphosphate farnesyltransferase